VGDLLYASTTTALSKLADVATGNALISGGVGSAPSYGKIGLATHVSGTLPVANGGTGVTSSTGTGSVVLSSSPTLTTPALGTPSALVGTNITGTASGLTAGNVTTNANLTGAITSTGNATLLGSFTSAQLLAALTDETGTGANVFATSPTLVTPVLGAATGTSVVLTGAAPQVTLGANVTTLGSVKMFGNTSGDATVRPAAVAGTATVVTLPNASSTLPIFGQQITFTGPTTARTITLPDASFTVARTDAANTFTGVQTMTSPALTTPAITGLATGTGVATANTVSTLVARDASGNFSAGTITASLTGNASGSAATFTSTSQNSQFNSVGVGTAGSGTAGEIRATNNITAYYSDDRFKTNLGNIPDALTKVLTLNGFYYEANELAQSYGYEKKLEVGVSAQQVQAVQPEVVAPAPIDENYLTVRYERLVPLLIEAIKELNAKVTALEQVVAKSTQG
jgi:hypothetical protein